MRFVIVSLIVTVPCLGAPNPTTGKTQHVLLDLQPVGAPVPALKYQLLPEASELNPGNAIPAYLKCFAEQNNFFFKKESVDDRERLLSCSLADIKPNSLKGYGGHALKQADHAARLEICDWNLLPQLRENGFNLLIPEIQQMRMLANALHVRCRGQIVDRDYAGAIHSLKTIFGLARHCGEHPTLIAGLVGVAIAQGGLNRLEELIQQPDAPNLYWAISQLPSPLIDIRRGLSTERILLESGLGKLTDKRPWLPEETAIAMAKASDLAAISELTPEERKATGEWAQARVKDGAWLEMARKSLVEQGYPADKVPSYPPEQVIFYRLLVKYQLARDERLKWATLPYWEAEAGLATVSAPAGDIEEKAAQALILLLPKVLAAQVRTEQRLALLRIVEAIRLDAAKNGKLPASLTDLSVPIGLDPVVGKRFDYKLDGMTAELSGKATTVHYRYELRLRK